MYNKAVRFVGISLPFLAVAAGALAFAAFRPVVASPQATTGLKDVRLPQAESVPSTVAPIVSLPSTSKPRLALASKPACEEFTRIQKLKLTGTTVVGWRVCP